MGILINFVFNEKDFSSFYILLSLINISFVSDKKKWFYLWLINVFQWLIRDIVIHVKKHSCIPFASFITILPISHIHILYETNK